MAQPMRFEVVEPNRLSAGARRRLTKELFELNREIFSGVPLCRFIREVISPPAEWTRIQVVRNSAGEPVAYCAVHLYRVHAQRYPLSVFRVEAGALREYRGRGMTFLFGLREALRYKFLHPFRSVYLFCTLVHPSSFHMLTQGCRISYPNPRQPTPEPIRHLMAELAEAFEEHRQGPGFPAVCQVGWVTRETEAETALWHASSEPDIRLFLSQNPGYVRGDGLITIVPISLENLTLTAIRWLKRRVFGRGVEKRKGAAS